VESLLKYSNARVALNDHGWEHSSSSKCSAVILSTFKVTIEVILGVGVIAIYAASRVS
jgi:hypothetical protein